jgi:hypothetical protein
MGVEREKGIFTTKFTKNTKRERRKERDFGGFTDHLHFRALPAPPSEPLSAK